MENVIAMFAVEAAVALALWAHCMYERLAISQAARRSEREFWWNRDYPDPDDYIVA
jgi:hypothetical protein